ncbi:MAG TPA: hypothetical protein VMV93_03520 [Chloroflexota bacterium]|nr:hypothetical protein [Chloroflexota bacterium]
MGDIRFDRLFRTAHSEGYSLMEGTRRLGRIDLHYTAATVYGTLVLEVDRDEPDILKMIEEIDNDLVLSAEVAREDFLVTVYRGTELGFYSDDYLEEEQGSASNN